MNYELFIARRLRLDGDGKRGVSTSTVIAITGIALSIVIMMAAICVVLGFKQEIRNKVMGFDAHVTIHPETSQPDETPLLTLTPELFDIIDETEEFTSSVLTMQQTGLLKTDNDFQAVVTKGLPPGMGWDFIKENIIKGSVPASVQQEQVNQAVISKTTADALSLDTGDRVYAYYFIDGAVKTRRLEIAAIYDTHFGDYDKLYIFTPLAFTQGLYQAGEDTGNRIELRVKDSRNIGESAMHLQQAMMNASYEGRLEGMYSISDVLDTAIMYFNWLELLDTNVVVILILMMLVSGFTLVSSLFIIILERVNMIGVLKALGATNTEIRRIFIYLAQKLVMIGMLIGNVTGIAFLYLQSRFHFLPLDADSYYLNYVPVEINWLYLLLLDVGVFVISGIMILVPSHIISTISPAKSIRYE